MESFPADVQFDVAVRVVGAESDFRTPHAVQVVLTDPDMAELGRLNIPVRRTVPGSSHVPGYELNAHVAARILLPADVPGGYDLSFALDHEPAHRVKTTITVVPRPK